MSDVGVNSVIEGIIAALDMEFGDDFGIYAEKTEQGFKEPCFFITALELSDTPYPANRRLRSQRFCVRYFPESGLSPRAECRNTAERLFERLEYITAGGDTIRGTRMSYEITEDILNFFVNYDYFIIRLTAEDNKMENLVRDISAKGDFL